eukprot:scaffold9704_cov153-Alexandrium_tamarense.AAC.2
MGDIAAVAVIGVDRVKEVKRVLGITITPFQEEYQHCRAAMCLGLDGILGCLVIVLIVLPVSPMHKTQMKLCLY